MRDPLRHSRPRPEPGPHLLCDFVVVGFDTVEHLVWNPHDD
jgi:hypothetical protein